MRKHCIRGSATMTSLDVSTRRTSRPAFKKYQLDNAYDEMFESSGMPRASYQTLYERLSEMPGEELRRRQKAADLSFLHQGITFTVYGREEGTEKILLTTSCRASSPRLSGPRSNAG